MPIQLIISIPLLVLFVVSLSVALSADKSECPRELLGYKCRYGNCDHSEKALKMAKITLRRNETWTKIASEKK